MRPLKFVAATAVLLVLGFAPTAQARGKSCKPVRVVIHSVLGASPFVLNHIRAEDVTCRRARVLVRRCVERRLDDDWGPSTNARQGREGWEVASTELRRDRATVTFRGYDAFEALRVAQGTTKPRQRVAGGGSGAARLEEEPKV